MKSKHPIEVCINPEKQCIFEKQMQKFKWFSIETGAEKTLLMPSFDHKYKINFCPFCGADTTDLVIKEKDFLDIVNLKL